MSHINKSLESIVFMNYIKYERLAELINYAYTGSNATIINLYIDLYPIIRSIYADTYMVSYNGSMDLVPLLINMCVHYRFFFKKYYNVYTNIYLVAGRNLPEISNTIVPNYNYTMAKRQNGPSHTMMDDMINTNFSIMNILIPYLPNVYFINTDFETSVAMGYIITNQENACVPNLVISKDIYPLQLVTSHKFNNTSFIMPFKVMDEENNLTDVSVIIGSSSNQNNWKDFWEFFTTHRKIKFSNDILINPANISPILSLSGLSERSINALMQFRVAYGMISQIIGNNPSQCSIETLYQNFDLDGKFPRNLVEDRFHVIDIVYQIDAIYSNSSEALLMKFENKHDPQTVKMICDKYFTNIPINLEKL